MVNAFRVTDDADLRPGMDPSTARTVRTILSLTNRGHRVLNPEQIQFFAERLDRVIGDAVTEAARVARAEVIGVMRDAVNRVDSNE
jgi:hypothetical protein